MKNIKIEIARQGNIIVAILLVHFVFFGYIANVFEKTIGLDIIFLNKVLFNPNSYFSIIILIAIIFFVVFREAFFEYGIRNSIMLVPIIIGMSWMWSWFINGFNLIIIPLFFVSLEGYLTILVLLGINFGTALFASMLKEKYKEYKKKLKFVEPI